MIYSSLYERNNSVLGWQSELFRWMRQWVRVLAIIGLNLTLSPFVMAQFQTHPQHKIIAMLQAKANTAINANRLTKPKHDNAYDYLKAILLLDPNNADAKRGLESLAIKYRVLVDSNIKRGNFTQARTMRRRALALFPNHPQLLGLNKKIERAQGQKNQQMLAKVDQLDVTLFPLPAYELSLRSQTIKSFLRRLAERIATSHETVLINARDDAEGRWMYKVMKEAAPGYRVRGDIRTTTKPSVELKAPILD